GLDLTDDRVDSFLEEMNIHCFKKEINQKEFLSKIEEVSNISNNIDMHIHDISSYINQKAKQLSELERKIEKRQIQITQQVEAYNITVKDLEEYRQSRPLVDKINKLEFMLSNKEMAISSLKEDLFNRQAENLTLKSVKYVLESEFIDANKWLPENNPLDIAELSRIIDEIYYKPSQHVDIIKLMRDRHPGKPKEKPHN
ncbi:MAG: hypothetical protein M3Z01_09130, partial [Thermoproteota archaeon]|nr:hypothetical protein [Thermoproteota archaeon]